MAKKSRYNKQFVEFIILVVLAIISVIFWDSILIYPIKLFVVLLHEISHGLAAIFTGGKVVSLEIYDNLGGKCISNGGILIIIANAGYLGSLGFGVLMFISAYKKNFSFWVNTGLSILLILFAANFMAEFTGIVYTMLFALVLFLSPRFFPDIIHSYIMKFLGLISALYVVVDIKEDIITEAIRETDALLIARLTETSPVFWGMIWLIISVAVIFYLLQYGYRRGTN